MRDLTVPFLCPKCGERDAATPGSEIAHRCPRNHNRWTIFERVIEVST